MNILMSQLVRSRLTVYILILQTWKEQVKLCLSTWTLFYANTEGVENKYNHLPCFRDDLTSASYIEHCLLSCAMIKK